MTHNPYLNYYDTQARTGQVGGGLAVFTAPRYQTGFGFRSLFTNFLPFVKNAGKTLLNSGVAVGKDLFEGEDVMKSLKKRGKAAAAGLAEDACDELRRRNQTGGGAKKKKKKKSAKDKKAAASLSTAELKKLLKASIAATKSKKSKRKAKKTNVSFA